LPALVFSTYILFFNVWRYVVMKYFSQFMLLALAVAVLLGLQYQYWLGENGHIEHKKLLTQIEEQQRLNDTQVADNDLLRTDVYDLKNGLEAVEEHARLDLGLIKPNETFVQVSTAPTTHSSQP
jgi:cell division protein FtsB